MAPESLQPCNLPKEQSPRPSPSPRRARVPLQRPSARALPLRPPARNAPDCFPRTPPSFCSAHGSLHPSSPGDLPLWQTLPITAARA